MARTNIILQFDLNRNIDAAARDVQAAINAARGQLPAEPAAAIPTYRKVNPADAPIMILALTSDSYAGREIYDAADSILAQKLSQVDGVGQVFVGGGASPAVRVELNPTAARTTTASASKPCGPLLRAANANTPKGYFAETTMPGIIDANDQLFKADDIAP